MIPPQCGIPRVPGRRAGADDYLVSVTPAGFEAQADWTNLRSPETYVDYSQGQSFALIGAAGRGARPDNDLAGPVTTR